MRVTMIKSRALLLVFIVSYAASQTYNEINASIS